ncbi:hypothetical protein TNCV_1683801 [Trichonephila clavipes]|nr:hypothetical protein TNCV_1683801 [Trichonephila clavipes]
MSSRDGSTPQPPHLECLFGLGALGKIKFWYRLASGFENNKIRNDRGDHGSESQRTQNDYADRGIRRNLN